MALATENYFNISFLQPKEPAFDGDDLFSQSDSDYSWGYFHNEDVSPEFEKTRHVVGCGYPDDDKLDSIHLPVAGSSAHATDGDDGDREANDTESCLQKPSKLHRRHVSEGALISQVPKNVPNRHSSLPSAKSDKSLSSHKSASNSFRKSSPRRSLGGRSKSDQMSPSIRRQQFQRSMSNSRRRGPSNAVISHESQSRSDHSYRRNSGQPFYSCEKITSRRNISGITNRSATYNKKNCEIQQDQLHESPHHSFVSKSYTWSPRAPKLEQPNSVLTSSPQNSSYDLNLVNKRQPSSRSLSCGASRKKSINHELLERAQLPYPRTSSTCSLNKAHSKSRRGSINHDRSKRNQCKHDRGHGEQTNGPESVVRYNFWNSSKTMNKKSNAASSVTDGASYVTESQSKGRSSIRRNSNDNDDQHATRRKSEVAEKRENGGDKKRRSSSNARQSFSNFVSRRGSSTGGRTKKNDIKTNSQMKRSSSKKKSDDKKKDEKKHKRKSRPYNEFQFMNEQSILSYCPNCDIDYRKEQQEKNYDVNQCRCLHTAHSCNTKEKSQRGKKLGKDSIERRRSLGVVQNSISTPIPETKRRNSTSTIDSSRISYPLPINLTREKLAPRGKPKHTNGVREKTSASGQPKSTDATSENILQHSKHQSEYRIYY